MVDAGLLCYMVDEGLHCYMVDKAFICYSQVLQDTKYSVDLPVAAWSLPPPDPSAWNLCMNLLNPLFSRPGPSAWNLCMNLLNPLFSRPVPSAWNLCMNHALALARAHVESVVLDSFQRAVAACADPDCRRALHAMCDLFALRCIEGEWPWGAGAMLHWPPSAHCVTALHPLCASLSQLKYLDRSLAPSARRHHPKTG